MKTKNAYVYYSLATALALSFGAPAISKAADESYKSETEVRKSDDGTYVKTTTEKAEDATGSSSIKTKVEKELNDDGTVDRTLETNTVKDPKGLGNREKTSTKEKTTYEDDKVVKTRKRTVNGHTVEDTEVEMKR